MSEIHAKRHLLATNLLRAGVMPSQLAGVIAEVEDSLWLAVTIEAAVTAAAGPTQADFDRAAAAAEKAIELGNTLAVMLRVRGPVLPRERYDAVLDSGPTEPTEGES